ncbi:hypothetical protein DEO72_LG4g1193 [Vigna unguiculata]|uniref:Uncharacterized protein n=1 Tax=Vigna unguiculata TaxID=3917 RepID=A0A4D6LP94_VIGUN|nr:hypothetical protein DEO72_LG4g1193 [Vigna unguiculata]
MKCLENIVWYYLAQARGTRLSENSWEPGTFHCSCSSGEEPHLWARGGLAQVRKAHPSENSQNSAELFGCSLA